MYLGIFAALPKQEITQALDAARPDDDIYWRTPAK